jgi:hypothetical protein
VDCELLGFRSVDESRNAPRATPRRQVHSRQPNPAAKTSIVNPINTSSTCQARGRANTGASQRAP